MDEATAVVYDIMMLTGVYTIQVYLLLFFITFEPRVEKYKVYEPYIGTLLEIASHFCEVFVVKFIHLARSGWTGREYRRLHR